MSTKGRHHGFGLGVRGDRYDEIDIAGKAGLGASRYGKTADEGKAVPDPLE